MKKLLIIGFVWPEPTASAAGSRMMQLITFFLSKSFNITFASSNKKNGTASNLSSFGISEETIKLNCSSFDAFVRRLNPDIVLFDRFMSEEQFGWRVSENCPNAVRILDTEDLHCLRKGRELALKDGVGFDGHYLCKDTAKREIASIYRCDLSLIISEIEMEILVSRFKVDKDLLHYLPFMLDDIKKEQIDKLPKFQDRRHIITIGNFLHPPNYDAVVYLKQAIWPLIRKELPEAELHVYGAYSSEKVNQLNNKEEGFLIKGFVVDANEVMQKAIICLAPLRFGAGLKGKLIDAMKNGTPCIMTSIASEGMFGEIPPNGLITDNPETFSKKAVQLYLNKELWYAKQQYGFSIINERFNKQVHYKELIKKMVAVQNHLKKRRLNNFTGQMLQHHYMQSTKYMSKWIEEKHKSS